MRLPVLARGDHGIRRFISLGDLVIERAIGSVAFETQALVGLIALRTCKQRIRHWERPGDCSEP